MPRWRIELVDGTQTSLEASADDIERIRGWLAECHQPVREIALISEGTKWPVWPRAEGEASCGH